MVSSPQGNATNGLPSKEDPRFPTWFQVPKGMLQTGSPPLGACLLFYEFQVPKGMLQTGGGGVSHTVPLCVSSPQGNATNGMYSFGTSITSKKVSSPQGNATNVLSPTYHVLHYRVSSPQGNATNRDCLKCSQRVTLMCFKSPRECYKLTFFLKQTAEKGFVSSPQGNATNTYTTSEGGLVIV